MVKPVTLTSTDLESMGGLFCLDNRDLLLFTHI